MVRLISHIPALLERKGWDETIFAAHMMILRINRDTSKKLARGSTNVNKRTLEAAATVLGVRDRKSTRLNSSHTT